MKTSRFFLLGFASLFGLGCSAGASDGSSSCEVTDIECIRDFCTDDADVLDQACVAEQCQGDEACLAALAAPPIGGSGDSMGGTGETSTLEEVRATCGTSNVGPRLLRRLSRGEVEATFLEIFPELASSGWEGVKLSPDTASPLGFTTDAAVLVVGGPMARELLKTAEEVATAIVSPTILPTVLPCASAADAACAGEFVNSYGLRLFRRPLSAEEVTRYTDYFQSVADRSDFAMGLKWALVAMIQSPHTVYRREIGQPAGSGFALDQYELATNLAYTFTGAPPDQELLDKAAAGALTDAAALRAEAARLLDTGGPNGGRGWNTVRSFFVDWLEYTQVLGQSRDDDASFSETITPLLIEETRLFLDQVVFGDGGDVSYLMKADFTALNPALSTFYGFGELTEERWDKVTRPAGQGLGLLAQGSLMAATSHQAASSPTLRGLLVSQRLMCTTRPAPPDVVPPLEDAIPEDAVLTTRQKYEEHHSQGVCGNCHRPFEPFGYTLEAFDELGKFRTMETLAGSGETLPIDTAATVELPDGTSVELANQEALASLVDTTDHVENCVSGLLAAYLLSGAGGTNCLAEEARAALAQGQMSLRDYVLSLAEAPHFSTRR